MNVEATVIIFFSLIFVALVAGLLFMDWKVHKDNGVLIEYLERHGHDAHEIMEQ